ncbi:hypothetical protein HDF18_16200 [Mucilaginibacter sp. X5P1]|uniref:hypothetical protein n=1 Tax=Mucilaginibacter sp. X5P1 TaxID=2723088 RepID=UPI0016084765|nr:hypothetical protein [Mucilaginibacter sp. X5P1]MBB6139169.1 hypothetical protein [Mucilaginibacter sp. X5P1]
MKKIVLVFFLLLIFTRGFSQLSFNDSPFKMAVFSFGAHQTIMNNPGFDNWASSNYNRTITSKISIEGDLTAITRNYEFGIHFTNPTPYGVGGLYAGRRLTPLRSEISSYLEFNIGGFFGRFKNLSPVNYKPTADQQGQDLELHYDATYIGLTSKNYFNNLHFRIGKSKGVSVNPGFYFAFSYIPFNDGSWSYGYNVADDSDPDNPSTSFNSVKVKGIPKLNNVFMDAGIFIGFGN